MKHHSRIGFLLGMIFFATWIQPLWADTTNISIEIGNGSGGGFSYSGIHAATGCANSGLYMCGDTVYWPLTGTLIGDLNTDGPISLANITGTLSAPQGVMTISNGQLSDTGIGGNASGFLNYTLTGNLNESGTFFFVGSQMCCSSAPNGGPNNLTDSGFTLWGNNWDVTAGQTRDSIHGTPLGIDVVGGNYVVNPEPSTIFLFGTGLLALPFLRRKKS